jgi:hypothetical protein
VALAGLLGLACQPNNHEVQAPNVIVTMAITIKSADEDVQASWPCPEKVVPRKRARARSRASSSSTNGGVSMTGSRVQTMRIKSWVCDHQGSAFQPFVSTRFREHDGTMRLLSRQRPKNKFAKARPHGGVVGVLKASAQCLRALSPLAAADACLLEAVSRHEFKITGLRNREVRCTLQVHTHTGQVAPSAGALFWTMPAAAGPGNQQSRRNKTVVGEP